MRLTWWYIKLNVLLCVLICSWRYSLSGRSLGSNYPGPLWPSYSSVNSRPKSKETFICIGYAGFYGSIWEEYHTGTLYLGYFSGPVEGTWGLMAAAVASGIYGPAVWRETVIFGKFSLQDVIILVYILGAFGTIIPKYKRHGYMWTLPLCSIMHALERKGPAVLRQLLPFSVFIGGCACLPILNPQILANQVTFSWFVFFTGIPVCTAVVINKEISSVIYLLLCRHGWLWLTWQRALCPVSSVPTLQSCWLSPSEPSKSSCLVILRHRSSGSTGTWNYF